MSSRVFSSSSTPPSSGSRSRPLPWTVPPPCKEDTLWYLQLNFLFTNVYHSFAPDKPTTLEYERLCAFLMIATIGLCCFCNFVYSFVLVSWMQLQWLDSSFPCPRSIDDIDHLCIAQDPVALILKAGELPSTALWTAHHMLQIYWLGCYNNEICFQRLAPVDLQKTVTEFPSHCCQDSSLFLLWQVKAW